MNTETRVCGIRLSNPLMNGAYIGSKTYEDVAALAQSVCGAVLVGSISLKPRKANPGPGYWKHKEGFFSLNSLGMPNGGLPYFQEHLPKMVEVVHNEHKPLIANLIGFNDAEFVTLIKFAQECGVDMVELNFGCPNVWEARQQKQILSYHPTLMARTLRAIAKSKPTVPICIKISPLPPDILQEAAKVIIGSGVVQAVTATNSYPNAAITTGARGDALPSAQLVGLTGRALKPISLGVVTQLHQLLPRSIDIIGCGGISSKNDVQDYLEAGAKAVQLATVLKDHGLTAFKELQA